MRRALKKIEALDTVLEAAAHDPQSRISEKQSPTTRQEESRARDFENGSQSRARSRSRDLKAAALSASRWMGRGDEKAGRPSRGRRDA